LSFQVFDLWDIFMGTAWLLIILLLTFYIRIRNKDKNYYKFYTWNVYFKLLFALVFAVTYIFVLGGGDTLAYWDGAVKLTNLFWEDPLAYVNEMFSTPTHESVRNNFTATTGYPPGWIYKEPESFYISKILSLINFITFDSFIAMTLVCSFIASHASWRFYELLRKYDFTSERWLLIAALFIPTVSFWCAGVSKDTFILASLFLLLYHIFALIDKDRKFSFTNMLFILVHVVILYNTRTFMLIAIAPPLLLGFGTGLIKRVNNSPIVLYFTRFILVLGTVVVVFLYFSGGANLGTLSPDIYLEEVAIIQQDFAQNKTYTGPRYDLGITDFTTVGMIQAAPLAIITAFFRPFLWEASSAFMVLSALEGTLLMVLLFRFIFLSGPISKQIQFVKKNELLVFSLVFILILGFFVGFSAGLFNVLIRFKAPLMPFILLLLATSYKWQQKHQNTLENEAESKDTDDHTVFLKQ